MGYPEQWKLLHILNNLRRVPVTHSQLGAAGIDCYSDTIEPLVRDGLVVKHDLPEPEYRLGPAGVQILSSCTVAKKWEGTDERVDAPRAFVVMPFSEDWSDSVYGRLIEPAIKGAGLCCVRGDETVPIGDLRGNVCDEILKAGIIVADVSSPNVNVFYELGLVHALGKDTLLLKEQQSTLPVDFRGELYCRYHLDRLDEAQVVLCERLKRWKKRNCCDGVAAITRA